MKVKMKEKVDVFLSRWELHFHLWKAVNSKEGKK